MGRNDIEKLPFQKRIEHKMRNPTEYESGSEALCISLTIQQEKHGKVRGEQKRLEGLVMKQKVIDKIIELLINDSDWSSSIDRFLHEPGLLKNDPVWRSLTGRISSKPYMPCQDHVRRIRDANKGFILQNIKDKTTQAG